MTMPRKGSRLITVDAVTYRWLVRRRPTLSQACGWRPLTFAVELAESPCGTLTVETASPRLDSWVGLGQRAGFTSRAGNTSTGRTVRTNSPRFRLGSTPDRQPPRYRNLRPRS